MHATHFPYKWTNIIIIIIYKQKLWRKNFGFAFSTETTFQIHICRFAHKRNYSISRVASLTLWQMRNLRQSCCLFTPSTTWMSTQHVLQVGTKSCQRKSSRSRLNRHIKKNSLFHPPPSFFSPEIKNEDWLNGNRKRPADDLANIQSAAERLDKIRY